MIGAGNIGTSTTSTRVVLPFYIYAAASFLLSAILLLVHAESFTGHYFHPDVLTLTHVMALGWGTMIILGASHQLVPVLAEGKLYSTKLAMLTFLFSAAGIPLLLFGFYKFDMGWIARSGGILIVSAIIIYVYNLIVSVTRGKSDNIHGVFIITAAIWLLATVTVGLLLVFNFNTPFLPSSSVHYLTLHAHLGIGGWFLMLVIGVGSRLIPMFLISKYTNKNLLRVVFFLLNGGILFFMMLFFTGAGEKMMLAPAALVTLAVIFFIVFCYKAYRERIRRQVDEHMRISLLSAVMMVLPFIAIIFFIFFLAMRSPAENKIAIVYGFVIFFGWLTAIILGMTFKTLPFIVWNKLYHSLAGKGKTANPKDMFSLTIIKWMNWSYLCGFVVFVAGILRGELLILRSGAILFILTAAFYNFNVLKIIRHKPEVK